MSKKNGWNIKEPDIDQFLENIRLGRYEKESLEATTTFTILRNSTRSETQIAELIAATGAKLQNIDGMIPLNFARLVLFETVASLETEVQMKEDDLKPLVLDIYRHHMKTSSQGEKNLKQIEKDLQKQALWETIRIMNQVHSILKSDVKK